MKKILFLGDFSVLDASRLEALAQRVQKDDEVFIAQGTLGNVSFNTSLPEEQQTLIANSFKFKFIDIEKVKGNFTEYAQKFVVESNDVLIKQFISDLNLKGRNDVEFLTFETSDPLKDIENLKRALNISITRQQNLTEQISDLKLLVAATIGVLTPEQQKEANERYAASKKQVSQTLQVSQSFVNEVSQSQEDLSIEDAITKFAETHELEGFLEKAMQTLQKLTNREDFEAWVAEKKEPAAIVNDSAVINAVIISYGATLK